MAANTVFIINNTIGTPIAAIQPNTVNGPGGVQQSSDLSMFGLGYATWGQASDQNDYRLLENFACPQSVVNPSPTQPMGEAELGAGNGINTPLVGQLWFNTSAPGGGQMYVNTAIGWKTVSLQTIVVPTGPVNPSPVPSIGSLFFNTGLNQLMISNGFVWESVAANYLPLSGGTMTGALNMGNNQIHSLANPTSPFDGANKQYVDTVAGGSGVGVFVPLAGGTMTGPLLLQTTSLTVKNGATNTLTVPANGQLVINTGNLTFISPASGTAINAGGGRIQNIGTPVGVADAVNSTYGDTRWLSKIVASVQTMAGAIDMLGSKITGLATPTIGADAVNLSYLQSNSTGVGSAKSSYNTISGSLPFTNGFIRIPGQIHDIIINFGYSITGIVTFSVPFTVGFFFGGCHTNRNSGGAGGYNHIYNPTTTTMGVVFDINPNAGWWFAVGI